jgi:GTP 3',8-cyclase
VSNLRAGLEEDEPWFSSVEIEVNSRCNRRCSYCPVSVIESSFQDRLMSRQLFSRIVCELDRIQYSGVLAYHFYNEPLLRRDLEMLVAEASARLPSAFQMLFTNGDLLSDQRFESLRNAGITHFVVTRHDGVPIKGRPNQTVQYPADLVLVNRGGFFKPLSEPLALPCYSPTDKLTIAVNGDVLVCCNDPERSQVMGNVGRESLSAIWNSAAFIRIRKLLQSGNRRDASPICRKCDDQEYFRPAENRHSPESLADCQSEPHSR